MLHARNDFMLKINDRERGRLKNYIRKRVSNNEDAEDILQDVFYQFVNLMQLENIEKAASWLFKVAGNRITDWYRKRKPVSFEGLKQSGMMTISFFPSCLKIFLYDPEEDPDKLYLSQLYGLCWLMPWKNCLTNSAMSLSCMNLRISVLRKYQRSQELR